MLRIAFSTVYRYELPEGHRFPMEKYDLLPEQLLYDGTVSDKNFFTPKYLSEEQILSTHTDAYWNKLKNLSLSRKEIRDIGFPVTKALIDRGRYIAMGTIQCCEFALQYGIAMNIAGGTHHAYADRGEGFCVYNDFAIAANYLLDNHLADKILIVDLDVHQGNGTAHIFRNESRVYTFSMHGERNYPLRKEQSDLDIGLADKTEDACYLNTLINVLPKLIDEVQPDLIMYLSGVDILASDKLGRLSLTKAGCKQRDEFVFETCFKNRIPVAVSMGGGYSEKISDIIDAHANTFRAAQSIYF